jgi:hypothetical protein
MGKKREFLPSDTALHNRNWQWFVIFFSFGVQAKHSINIKQKAREKKKRRKKSSKN